MKHRLGLPLLVLFLTLGPTALASSKWYVDGVHGSDNNSCKSRRHACKTIGHAISLASSRDSIRVTPATYTENLTIGLSLRVIGSGAATTIIDGGGVDTAVTISGGDVTLAKLTIRNGDSAFGGGISNAGALMIDSSAVSGNFASGNTKTAGGGIYNRGLLVINNSTITGNTAIDYAVISQGGGIENNGGTLTINNSTVSGNNATGTLQSQGGGIDNFGTLTITNSTISGNTASGPQSPQAQGGGISNSGALTISNSTLSDNTATGSPAQGGGIYNNRGTAALRNSIVANSPSGGTASAL